MIGMFRFLTEILEKKTWLRYALLSFISPVVDIFSFSVMIYIIDRVVRENQASDGMILFTFFMIVVSLLKCLFEQYKCRVANRFLYRDAHELSLKIYELLIKENLMEHNRKTAMQALNLVRQDTTGCIQILVDCVGVAVNGVTMAGYGALLIYVSGWAGAASCLALVIFLFFVFVRIRGRMLEYGERSRSCSVRANSQVTIAYGAFKEMKIDDRSDFMVEKYKDAGGEYAQVQWEYKYRIGSIGIFLQNSVMAVLFAVLAAIFLFGKNIAVILVPMVVYITALVRMLPMAYGVLSGLNNVEFSRKSFEAVKESMAAYERMKKEEALLGQLRRKKLTFHKGISVQNLTFGYPGKAMLFEDASMEIPAGCSVAVIGVSGVGKTTLVDLILGLLQPQGGHVFYDDYDLVEQRDGEGSCRVSLGELVSYIPQTVYLNGETIRNNVAFFARESEIDEARVEECLKCARLWEDVMQMPDGVHTLIGENGTAISGGQRQRVALARALYKDFELLVMDEATAALDMETETAVIDSIRHVRRNKTLLMVTHHMSLANECDIVYKIEDKKIVQVKGEAGTG